MRSKGLWLVQENHATIKLDLSVASRGIKTCSETRIELRNLQIQKKLLDNSSQFLSSEQPSEPKNLDVALNIARVEKIHTENLRLWSVWRPFDSSFERKGAIASVTVKICVLYVRWFSNKFGMRYSWPWAEVSCTLLAAVPWNGLEHSHRKSRCFFYLLLRSDVLMFRILDISQCVNNYFETEKSWVY